MLVFHFQDAKLLELCPFLLLLPPASRAIVCPKYHDLNAGDTGAEKQFHQMVVRNFGKGGVSDEKNDSKLKSGNIEKRAPLFRHFRIHIRLPDEHLRYSSHLVSTLCQSMLCQVSEALLQKIRAQFHTRVLRQLHKRSASSNHRVHRLNPFYHCPQHHCIIFFQLPGQK